MMDASKQKKIKKLSRNMVLMRSRGDSIDSVKKLNLWGQGISDISIVKQMPNLEIVTLSLNAVEELEPFSACSNLQELYLRSNDVADLRQICHLKELDNLTKLWLSDNPCTNKDNYRSTVIRTLPQLTVLDDSEITEDEREEASTCGVDLDLDDENCEETVNLEEVSLSVEDGSKEEESPADKPESQVTAAEELEVKVIQAEEPKSQVTAADVPEDKVTSAEEPEVKVTSTDESDVNVTSVDEPEVKVTSADEPEVKATAAEEPKPSEDEKEKFSGHMDLDEINKLRATLGLRPVAPAPAPSFTPGMKPVVHQNPSADYEVRTAVLHLIRVMDKDSLEITMEAIKLRLKTEFSMK